MTAVLRAEALTKVFGAGETAVHALTGVDLELDEGELVVLRGASGSGKTTLLNLLGGLDAPTGGRVLLGDTDLTAAPEAERIEARRRRLGFVFQSFALIPTLSAAENVELPLRLIGTPVEQRTARVAALLEQVGLADAAAQRPAELSGGQQQRVGFARALAASPSILLADEPTGQLDSGTGERLMELLGSLVHDTGVTAIVATHDPRLADRADRVLSLRDGRLAAGGRHAAPAIPG